MAINVNPPWVLDPYAYDSQLEFTHQVTAIGGKLVRCTMEFPEQKIHSFGSEKSFRDHVKYEMSIELAKYMLSNNLVEFTYMEDRQTGNTRINVRCYLAPDDQIKFIRTHYNV